MVAIRGSDEAESEGEADGDAPIRGQVRLVDHRRVLHGVYLRKRPELGPKDEFVRDLKACQTVLPPGAVFTHVTAARVLGWRLPKLPEQVPVFAAVGAGDRRPRRPGLICSRLRRTPHPDEPRSSARLPITPVPIDSPEEILLRAARDLGVLDLTVMIDSARRLGHIDEKRMELVLASGRPGVRLLRAAWERSDPRADSGTETLLRVFHEAIDVPVTPQAELFDADGALIGKGDLLVDGTCFVHEYDGEHHRDARQQRTDLRRERRWHGTGYVRSGFTLDDLLNHPMVMMHEIDRALERPHHAHRLARWRRLVDNSLYSQAGRERVMNRWRRQMPLLDWSKTA